ncbi:MAG: methyltransferase [Methyloprofundus sp.]|nr:methyltransferase [Methyloprofundus sp.]
MQRIVEPELMNDKAQAEAYANADFEQADKLFIDTFKLHFPYSEIEGNLLDLGCGPGNISFLFAKHFPHINVIGIDG